MSEDWKPGDLAVCVDDSPNPITGRCRVREGKTYTVTSTRNGLLAPDYRLGLGVTLAGFGGQGFDARRFRKVRPDQHESCEEEFATLLNRSKRRVGA